MPGVPTAGQPPPPLSVIVKAEAAVIRQESNRFGRHLQPERHHHHECLCLNPYFG
jgi:hypothetical protein